MPVYQLRGLVFVFVMEKFTDYALRFLSLSIPVDWGVWFQIGLPSTALPTVLVEMMKKHK